MKNKFRTSILFLAIAGAIVATTKTIEINKNEVVNAANQTFSSNQFVKVDNFVNSGLGFQMEFTFDVPTSKKVNTFDLLEENWHRLTNNLHMTFNTDGSVSADVGKVFKDGDSYFYQLMFADLKNHLNNAGSEKAYGTETVGIMYISDAQVLLDVVKTNTINTLLNASSLVEIRDDAHLGLKFKAHLPAISSSNTYGMVIVPNQFVAKYNADYIKNLSNDGKNYIDLRCEPNSLSNSDELYKKFGPGYYIQGTISNILEDNYQIPFCAIPYEKDKSGTIKYANLIKLTKTTLYETCHREVEEGLISELKPETVTFINKIINKCENHTVNLKTNNVTAYFAYNTEQILKTDPLPSSLNTKVLLQGAQNEKESGQIILKSALDFDKKYYVNFEPFINQNNPSIKFYQDRVTISKQLYQNVLTNWDDYKYMTQGYYHEGCEPPKTGWFPDALLPFDLAVDSGENILTTENGSNNGISFTVNIPKDIEPGIYNSKVVIKILDEGTICLPVELTVFDFSLDQNHSKYVALINDTEIKYVYGDEYNGEPDSPFYKAAWKEMADRGIAGGQLPAKKWSKSDIPLLIEQAKKSTADPRLASYLLPCCYDLVSCDINFSYEKKYYTQTKTYYKTISLSNSPVLVGKDYPYERDKTITIYGYETLLEEFVKASTNELDLLKKAVIYFPQADEPGTNEVKQLVNVLSQNTVLQAINAVASKDIFEGKEKVKESLLDLAYICTSHPRGLLKGYISDNSGTYQIKSINSISNQDDGCKYAYLDDVSNVITNEVLGFCPQYDCFEYYNNGTNDDGYQDVMARLNDDKYTMWWYGCCMPVCPYPNNCVNAPFIRSRANKWLQYKYGVEGELYYMCNRGSQVIGSEGDNPTYIPKTESEILAGECTYNGIYGEGQYLYPVHNLYKNYDPHLYYLSTLRLDNLGEANDDYNYLYLANELIKKLSSSEQEDVREQISDLINSITGTYGPYKNTTNHSLLYQTKTNLANVIANIK